MIVSDPGQYNPKALMAHGRARKGDQRIPGKVLMVQMEECRRKTLLGICWLNRSI